MYVLFNKSTVFLIFTAIMFIFYILCTFYTLMLSINLTMNWTFLYDNSIIKYNFYSIIGSYIFIYLTKLIFGFNIYSLHAPSQIYILYKINFINRIKTLKPNLRIINDILYTVNKNLISKFLTNSIWFGMNWWLGKFTNN